MRLPSATVGLFTTFVFIAALTGCTTTGGIPAPASSSTVTRTSAPESDSAVAPYRNDLPEGYAWPDAPRESGNPLFETADDYAQGVWACIRLDAAWAAIDAGDPAEADRLVAPVYDTSSLWASDPPTFGSDPYARDWGWHGICTQQLGLLDYPVRGLLRWSPPPPPENPINNDLTPPVP